MNSLLAILCRRVLAGNTTWTTLSAIYPYVDRADLQAALAEARRRGLIAEASPGRYVRGERLAAYGWDGKAVVGQVEVVG